MNINLSIIDQIDTSIGKIPVVPEALNFKDHIGKLKVRLNIGRMNYVIGTGLYAVGNPNAGSPVLVSANFKMSFDYLRKELQDIDAWILVLDTKGINVWCAAGKGTFGTDELIRQIREVRIDRVVNHRQLIVPQLGAPGVAAYLVKEATGFKVIYGPIRAVDISAFLEAGNKATEEMRTVRFNMNSRFALVPVDFAQGFKYVFIAMVVIFLFSGLNVKGYSVDLMLSTGSGAVIAILLAFLSGVILTPLFLPYLPGSAFAFKGFSMTIPIFVLLYFISNTFQNFRIPERIACFLLMSSISSFFAMNFTGASTYTSLSGVKKEMRIAVPLQIAGFVLGLMLWIIIRFI